ncbi:MAG TPA: SIMPL domain-containing protein [Candidatus Bilamarchaeum sp.]|nr:SIMPL domain-containing protein [Candidatus Bilamarchaeum sp.]
MAKDDMESDSGKMMVIAAVILTIGIVGGSYLLAQGDYAPKVNVTGGPSSPNVYVSSTPPDHVISVSGTASKKVAPDLLNIQLRVQTESTLAKTAQEDNAAVSADLRAKLKALGVKDEDIQTVSYSVDPIYESDYVCDKGGINCRYKSTLTGYRATHSLNVRMTDLTKGGDVIDAAGSAGQNQTFVDYVSFGLKDETRNALEKTLLQQAGADAKSRAQSIAAGLGVSVGKVLSASESFYYPTPYYYKGLYAAADAAPSVPTQLSPGQVDVSVTVSTSFEVGS